MTAITAVSSSSDAQSELVKYQQKLAADLAEKADTKVIAADKVAVAKAQKAVQQEQQPSAPATGSSTIATTSAGGSGLDVTA